MQRSGFMPAQLLKILVIVMSIAILVAFALVVYGIVGRVAGPANGGGFGARDLAVPEGCAIAAANLQEGRLVLRLGGPAAQGCQQVVLVDPASGTVEGRLTARPGAAMPGAD